jgi:hypothetical protein
MKESFPHEHNDPERHSTVETSHIDEVPSDTIVSEEEYIDIQKHKRSEEYPSDIIESLNHRKLIEPGLWTKKAAETRETIERVRASDYEKKEEIIATLEKDLEKYEELEKSSSN